MDAFISFHAPGFWLVIALLAGVVALGVRPYLRSAIRLWVMVGYWVLIPYLALITGGVSPRLMGFQHIDWVSSLQFGIGLALGMVGLAVVARVTLLAGAKNRTPVSTSFPSDRWLLIVAAFALSGAEEWFWCFLRSAVSEVLWMLQLPLDVPAYWSVWIAAALAMPFALAAQSTALERLVKASILAMTSILFFYTYNFWLCWAVHAIVWLLLAQPTPNASADESAPLTGRSL